MPRLPYTCARLPALVSRIHQWRRSHLSNRSSFVSQTRQMNMATRGQQTPVVSRSDGSSTCPPARPLLPVVRPVRMTEATFVIFTHAYAILRNVAGGRDRPGMKYGGGMGSSELYQYLVEHSYRPNKHLDALHEVNQYYLGQ